MAKGVQVNVAELLSLIASGKAEHALLLQLPCDLDAGEDLVAFASKVEGSRTRRSFDILLYTGAPVARWGTRMVFDLGGMTIPNRQLPVLFAHDPERPIGFSSEKPTTTKGLRVKATALDNQDARFVQDQADQGLKWQASMGVRLTEVRYLEEGEVREVNGADFKGPGYVVTKSVLLEASILTLGADGDTQSVVLRQNDAGGAAPTPTPQERPMISLKEFLAAFPQNRRGWAAEKFADLNTEGMTLAQAVAAVKAQLADELLAERGKVDEELAEAKKRLEVLGSEGLKEEETPTFSGSDQPGTDKVDLEAYGERLAEMPRAELKELLKPEWLRMKPTDQIEFGDFDNYAAYRRASAQGRVTIRLGPPAER